MAEETGRKSRKDQQELMAVIRKRFGAAAAAERDNRRNYVTDVSFSCAEDQWPADVKRKRGAHRPALTFNRLNPVVKQIIGDYRQNKMAIKVLPADGDASEETAEILAGLIRNIEAQSNADTAYTTALECAARGGFGWFRVVPEYTGDDVFDQDLVIKPIHNPLTVYCDPAARLITRADANWMFVTEMMNKELFKKAYPKAALKGFETWDDNSTTWFTDEEIRIAEYFEKERYAARLGAFDNGMVTEIDDDAQIDALAAVGINLVREREAERTKIVWRKVTGVEELETREYRCRYIPLIPVIGEEVNVEGKVLTRSAIFYGKDAQRTYNYSKSTAVEMAALAPKAPWLVTPEQIEGHQEQWDNVNTTPTPYLLYNVDDRAGKPDRIPPTPPPSAELSLALNAGDDIKATTGIYDASLGARSNETSGRAIVARQQEGATSTFIFIDNLKQAIEHCGRVLIDWLPVTHDAERVVRVLDLEGNPKTETINRREYDPLTGVTEVLNGITVGKYDVVISVGPSFANRKAEMLAAVGQLAQAYPPLMQLAGDLLVGSMDFPGAEKVAERLKRAMPAAVVTDPDSPEAQQAADAAKQEAQEQQAKQQELQEQALAVEQAKVAAELAKAQATIAKAEADTIKARSDAAQALAEPPEPVPEPIPVPIPAPQPAPPVTIQFNAEHALSGIGQTMTGMAEQTALAAGEQMALIGQILQATAEGTAALAAALEGQRQDNAQHAQVLAAALDAQRQAGAEQVNAVIAALLEQQRLTGEQAAAMQQIGRDAAQGNLQVADAVQRLAAVMAAPRVAVRDKQGNIVASEVRV